MSRGTCDVIGAKLDTSHVERDSFHMTTESKGGWLTRQMERESASVRRVADAMGVTTKTVYEWLNGKTAVSEERVPRLAEVLGVSEIEARRGLGYWVPADEPAVIAVPGALDRQLRREMAELQQDLAGLDPSRRVSYRILSQALKTEIEGIQLRLRQLEELRDQATREPETGS